MPLADRSNANSQSAVEGDWLRPFFDSWSCSVSLADDDSERTDLGSYSSRVGAFQLSTMRFGIKSIECPVRFTTEASERDEAI